MPLETEKSLSLKERDALIEEIIARTGVRAARGRRFAELTSLRVGGAIDWVISPEWSYMNWTGQTFPGGRLVQEATCWQTTAIITTWS